MTTEMQSESISKTKLFEKTQRQRDAIDLLASKKHAMCYGGSRSGKTFIICYAIIVRASKTKSRHLACRFKFNHAKTSLWLETFPKVFALCFPNLSYKENKSDYYYKLRNGSEIWVSGLDEKDRTEKILGKEYSTIYFNECSQIPYTSVTMALTRLAEKNDLPKRVFYDENPPTRRHWSYPLFMLGKDPHTYDLKKNKDDYGHILMNPQDNMDNIDQEYLDLLDSLPEKDKQRFLKGEFSEEDDYSIYYAFDREKHVKKCFRNPNYPILIGMDFNVNPMTAVVMQNYGGSTYVIDEFWEMGSDTRKFSKLIKLKYGTGHQVIPDSTGKALKTSGAGLSDHMILEEEGFRLVGQTNPFRVDRYNCVNNFFEKGKITIDPKCQKLIMDLEQVAYKEGSSMPDTKDKSLTHISDALGYGLYWIEPLLKPKASVGMLPR